jgi:glucose/mannose-6-phosphate isomerase
MTTFHHPCLVLDNAEEIRARDPEGMLEMAENFAEQCRQGLARGDALALDDDYLTPANIVVAGMGGSAICGDLAQAIFSQRLKVPAVVPRDYHLPGFVSRKTLVFAISHSGDTAETISAFKEGLKARARLIAICSGGRLKDLAAESGTPWVEIPIQDSPRAYQRPRACTGFALMPMVAIFERLGPKVLKPEPSARDEALQVLQQQGASLARSVPINENQAKRLAARLADRFPLVYGAVPWLGPVALRWRTQLNENGKALALSHQLPELDHNEVVAWSRGAATVIEPVCIWLRPRDEDLDPEMQARLRLTPQVTEAPAYQEHISASGVSRLAQVLSLVHLGDMVSLYLAFLYGVDPADTGPISRLKAMLEQAGHNEKVARKPKRS